MSRQNRHAETEWQLEALEETVTSAAITPAALSQRAKWQLWRGRVKKKSLLWLNAWAPTIALTIIASLIVGIIYFRG